MRENIGLFKAKRKDNGEWVEGYYIKHKYGSYILCGDEVASCCALRNKEIYEIDPETICECTGLKDKNGKLIFENDEIYFLDGMSTENGFDDFNNTGFVKWSEEEARFYVTDRESVSSEDALNYCTIIGNKFEEVKSETHSKP